MKEAKKILKKIINNIDKKTMKSIIRRKNNEFFINCPDKNIRRRIAEEIAKEINT